MSFRRRWLQFSLRGFLVAMTAFAVWLGVISNRAREQREAVNAIKALGGDVTYDFQIIGVPYGSATDPPYAVPRIYLPDAAPSGPVWLRRLVGDDFFREVVAVNFSGGFHPPTESDIRKAIPYLKRLRGLKRVAYWADVSDKTSRELKDALPNTVVDQVGASFSF